MGRDTTLMAPRITAVLWGVDRHARQDRRRHGRPGHPGNVTVGDAGQPWVPTFVFPKWPRALTVLIQTRWATDVWTRSPGEDSGFPPRRFRWPVVRSAVARTHPDRAAAITRTPASKRRRCAAAAIPGRSVSAGCCPARRLAPPGHPGTGSAVVLFVFAERPLASCAMPLAAGR